MVLVGEDSTPVSMLREWAASVPVQAMSAPPEKPGPSMLVSGKTTLAVSVTPAADCGAAHAESISPLARATAASSATTHVITRCRRIPRSFLLTATRPLQPTARKGRSPRPRPRGAALPATLGEIQPLHAHTRTFQVYTPSI